MQTDALVCDVFWCLIILPKAAIYTRYFYSSYNGLNVMILKIVVMTRIIS